MKTVVAERFIRTLENKIYKHMTAVSKSVYDEYNNTYHNTIKMKLIDVKSDSHAEYIVDSNEKYPKLKVADHVRISKYKNIFVKVYAPNWSEENLELKWTYVVAGPWIYVISDLNGEEIIGTFYEKELLKT